LLLLVGKVESIPLLISTILSLLCFEKEKLPHSWRDVARVVWGLFMFFPVLWIYIALLMSAFVFPLIDAVFWLSPVRKYWLGALLFLPFLFLFMLIFLPDQKPRKMAAQMWLIVKGRASIPTFDKRKAVATLLILVWLVLVFLPLPSILLVNLVLIAGGLLVVAYLGKERHRARKK
jgi:hypothetical protein